MKKGIKFTPERLSYQWRTTPNYGASGKGVKGRIPVVRSRGPERVRKQERGEGKDKIGGGKQLPVRKKNRVEKKEMQKKLNAQSAIKATRSVPRRPAN